MRVWHTLAHRRALVLLAASVILASGCSGQNVPPVDDAGMDGSAGQQGTSGAGGEPSEQCPTNLPGPSMALLATPSGVHYCIDTTEVTQGQYAEFIAGYEPPSGRIHDLCEEPNTQLEPLDGMGGLCPLNFYTPSETPEQAMTCVDFCDAISYCHWAGKRLCGVHGRAGEVLGSPADPDSDYNLSPTDPDRSQWFHACSSGGVNIYAYGDSYDPNCEGIADAGTRAQCATSGEPAIFDMSGNVEEWEDLCASDGSCQRRGGRASQGEATTCANQSAPANPYGPSAGFRCCYEF